MTQNPFRFLLSFRRREEGRAIGFPFLFCAFLPLPPLFAPATQVTSHGFSPLFFFVEIWQSGRGRPPASCQLTRMYAICVCHMQAYGRENADRTHVEKSETRLPRVLRITLY